MSESSRLPTGWTWSDLNSVCTKVTDGTHHCPEQEVQLSCGDYLYITAKNIKEWGVDLSNVRYIPEHIHRPIYERCNPEQGDILYIKGGVTTGIATINQLDEEFSLLSSVALLKPRHEVIDARFLRWYLNSPQGYRSMTMQMGGTAIKRLTVKKIKESRIPVAPFNEQRRIVERIEELLSDLDAGVAALERAKENLTRYRAAVLKAAVEGRLTEQWRAEHPSMEPASKLLKFILAEHHRKWEDDQLAKRKAQGREPSKYRQDKHKGPSSLDTIGLPPLPKDWCWATVDQLAIVVRGASPPPTGDPRYFGGNAMPWITVGSLTADDQPYLYEVHEFLTEEGRQKSRYIEADTLLLTNSGATLGVPKITMIGGCINDGSVALLGVDYPLKLYLYYFLASQTERIRAINQGVAQSNLNTGIVKAITVPLPPVREQSAIIEIIEERLWVSNKTKIQLECDLKRAAYLRQSILKRACEGKLPSQDQNNEPASVLLEHIKAEKSVQGKQVKPRHTGRRTRIVKFKGAKRSLLDVIRENPSGITPEELLASANYSIDEVDLFYARLAEIKGDIVEQKPSGLEARKWPYEAKVILRSKG